MPTKNEIALCGILESYRDIGEDLSFVLESFELTRSDIESAIEDLYDQLETIQDQIESCTRHYILCRKKMQISIPDDYVTLAI